MTIKKRLSSSLVAMVAGGALALSPVLGTTDAGAATAGSCSSTLGYNIATGGCSAPVPYQPGEDQMVLTCYAGGGFYDVPGAWHDHYSDWQETLACGESDTAYSVSFNSR